jgi:signal transduction histidine kinase
MRERARMLGGTLTARPLAQGGFEVVFAVPTAPPAE